MLHVNKFSSLSNKKDIVNMTAVFLETYVTIKITVSFIKHQLEKTYIPPSSVKELNYFQAANSDKLNKKLINDVSGKTDKVIQQLLELSSGSAIIEGGDNTQVRQWYKFLSSI